MAPSTRPRRSRGTAQSTSAAAETTPPPSKKVKTEASVGEAWVDVVKGELKSPASTPLPQQRRAATKTKSEGAVVAAAVGGGELAVATSSQSPYPEFKRPSAEECWFARDALAQLHSTFFAKYEQAGMEGGHALGPGSVPSALLPPSATATDGNGELALAVATPSPITPQDSPVAQRKSVLDSLVGTILSQNTTDTNSHRAFGILKSRFPTWEQVRVAKPKLVEDAIKCGGEDTHAYARIYTRCRLILHAIKGTERGKENGD